MTVLCVFNCSLSFAGFCKSIRPTELFHILSYCYDNLHRILLEFYVLDQHKAHCRQDKGKDFNVPHRFSSCFRLKLIRCNFWLYVKDSVGGSNAPIHCFHL